MSRLNVSKSRSGGGRRFQPITCTTGGAGGGGIRRGDCEVDEAYNAGTRAGIGAIADAPVDSGNSY